MTKEGYAESFKLVEVFGIRTDEFITVQPGQSIKFSLRFERIPDSLETFHLIEEKGTGDDDRTPWTFNNVQLIR
ncbi:hypothetical protein HC931_26265 [Candidatus Gracilibacteria bacterium]|nr:hypothetical protein [Candidatus Gracilibacteria bacterium]NJM90156.1 hypothetical protein [Hydrococcus sp. RU_2_2]NJP22019.1 hypothetical protein [Hydrococcus sp. CRU_1_1]